MKLCTTCGNEIEDASWKCPFCEELQTPAGKTRGRDVATLNLEKGLPAVDEALDKLDRDLVSHRQSGIKLVRVIHGWGSSGTGGKIKQAVRKRLSSAARRKAIREFLPGENYSKTTNAGRKLLAAHPSLRSSLRSGSDNPGITFVEI